MASVSCATYGSKAGLAKVAKLGEPSSSSSEDTSQVAQLGQRYFGTRLQELKKKYQFTKIKDPRLEQQEVSKTAGLFSTDRSRSAFKLFRKT